MKFRNGKFALILCSGLISLIVCSCQEDSKVYENKIGIIQLVEHDALDSARRGFIDGLSDSGYIDGKNIKIDYQNAQGDQSNCFTISNKLLNDGNNLIFAISTPAAQSVANITSKVPILFTCVTDPVSANLVESNEYPNGNITGTSDLSPISKQIGLISELFPYVRKIGILYSTNESNSRYQAEIAINEINNLGLESETYTFSQMSEIDQTVQLMTQKCDAIYTPTDNMVASSMPSISNIALSAKIPIICGEVNLVSKGALGTYGIDYYKLGKITSEQAINIIKYDMSPSQMKVKFFDDVQLVLNKDIINQLNLDIPPGIMKKAKLISSYKE